MISLDRRTRTNGDIRETDPTAFFEEELPELIRMRGRRAVPGAREFGATSITYTFPKGSWTLALTDDGLALARGDSGTVALRMGPGELSDIVKDLSTPEMLIGLRRVVLARGDRSVANVWWAILRALLDDRPMHTAGAVTFKDRSGGPLDLGRAFTPADDDADIAHFLGEAGFLHLSGWLDPKLMEEIDEDIVRVLPKCTPDDGSWWATMKDGTRQAVRIVDFARHSEPLRKILASERFRRIGQLTEDGYVAPTSAEALHKPIGVAAGISDIGWHNDCTQGMHSHRCCTLVVGICVTGAAPGSARLGVVPGSHRALMPYDRVYPHTGLKGRHLTTKPGDMTVHCSCTMHMAETPTNHVRKVLYTGFTLPEADLATLEDERRTFEARHQVQQLAGEGATLATVRP